VRGAEVTLISGPTSLPLPPGVDHTRIESTEDLKDAVAKALPSADALIMAAAPSDYHPGKPAAHKTKREAGPLQLKLEPTPDVLATTAKNRKHGAVIVGFALETRDVVAAAQAKLKSKKLDLVIANSATEPGSGPESLTNRITIVSKDGMEALPQMQKEDAAEAILDRVGALLAARG
jgi:phosphopantothenoylcysteine decarboxylase/phosphopantothenate--cysteine ligase